MQWLKFECNLNASDKNVHVQCDIIFEGDQQRLFRNEFHLEVGIETSQKEQKPRKRFPQNFISSRDGQYRNKEEMKEHSKTTSTSHTYIIGYYICYTIGYYIGYTTTHCVTSRCR